MQIRHVSVGRPGSIEFDGKTVTTGIFKRPVEGAVAARWLNLDGDGQADLTVHGGRDKAIYLYSYDYYPVWACEFGMSELEPSQFGENLTVSGCRDDEVLIGTRYRIGSAEATVMQPRIPCFKLGIRLGDASFPKTFWAKGRLGFYLRVEKEGSLECGDSLEVLETPAHGITVRGLWTTVTGGSGETAENALNQLPDLDSGWVRRLKQVVRNRG